MFFFFHFWIILAGEKNRKFKLYIHLVLSQIWQKSSSEILRFDKNKSKSHEMQIFLI